MSPTYPIEPFRERFNKQFGYPPERATIKLRPFLHQWVQDFIRCSPFVILATSNGKDACSVSPRGGPCGFVRIINDRTLLLPDVPGNYLFHSYANVEQFDHLALLFLVPGLQETARVSGKARIISAEEVSSLTQSREPPDKRIIQGLLISVELAFGHCGRSIKLADLWNETTIMKNRIDRPVVERPKGI
jgi:predicted pyridoxine 5'-phosphate oxidase superfamily flavin-nucleotide-binding protein